MEDFTKFEQAEVILDSMYENVSGYMIGGFHYRLYGGDRHNFDASSNSRKMFDLADKLIGEGKIFYVNNFKCKCGSYRYQYGGGWACDYCQNCINTPPWWKIKVQKDGNMYICIGNGFKNLQESDNYAFGETEQIARDNYRALYI